MQTVQLLAVGDVSLHTAGSANPLAWLGTLRRPDGVIAANLETALTDRAGGRAEKAVTLCAPTARAAWLAEAGVDVVNVANNHVLDAGPDGFDDTLAALAAQGIAVAGGGCERAGPVQPPVLTRGGLRLGFLGYASERYHDAARGHALHGVHGTDLETPIRALRAACDAVIVALHWGVEDAFYPSPEQIRVSRAVVDAGAAVVLTHHAHVVQGVERWGRGVIAYSLGNFCFPAGGDEARRSFVLRVELERGGVRHHDLLPVQLDAAGVPHPMAATGAEALRRTVAARSAPVAANRITEAWWYANIAPVYLRGNLRAWGTRFRRHGLRPAPAFLRWLASRFVWRCGVGLLRPGWRVRE